jgi:hypothetical protein
VLENFFFLGLIAAKALQDGWLFPLPIHHLFFELALSPNSVDAAAVLSGPSSYMSGCSGETVAQMMALLPVLRSAYKTRDRANSTGSNSSPLISQRKRSDGNEESLTTGPKSLNEIFDATYSFTSGLTLRNLITTHSFEFVDPITGIALNPLPNQKEGPSPTGMVTPANLLCYLETVADFWLKTGVSRQIDAFKQGVSQVFDWSYLKSFTARELSDMVCGAGDVEWNEKSLRKMLTPTSGFDIDSPTMKWLRSELVSFNQAQRRSFLKFSTALPRLIPGMTLTIACKGVGGSWLPTAQTCTPQLNLPVYASKKDLKMALKEAMANADADGGFHERTAGSDGNSDEVRGHRRSGREERALQVQLPASMRQSESSSTTAPAAPNPTPSFNPLSGDPAVPPTGGILSFLHEYGVRRSEIDERPEEEQGEDEEEDDEDDEEEVSGEETDGHEMDVYLHDSSDDDANEKEDGDDEEIDEDQMFDGEEEGDEDEDAIFVPSMSSHHWGEDEDDDDDDGSLSD